MSYLMLIALVITSLGWAGARVRLRQRTDEMIGLLGDVDDVLAQMGELQKQRNAAHNALVTLSHSDANAVLHARQAHNYASVLDEQMSHLDHDVMRTALAVQQRLLMLSDSYSQ